MANLPQSGRPKKLSMEANSVSGNSAKEVLPKGARIYAKIGQRDQNTSCFSFHSLVFSVLLGNVKYFTPFTHSFINVCLCRMKKNKGRLNAKIL